MGESLWTFFPLICTLLTLARARRPVDSMGAVRVTLPLRFDETNRFTLRQALTAFLPPSRTCHF